MLPIICVSISVDFCFSVRFSRELNGFCVLVSVHFAGLFPQFAVFFKEERGIFEEIISLSFTDLLSSNMKGTSHLAFPFPS